MRKMVVVRMRNTTTWAGVHSSSPGAPHDVKEGAAGNKYNSEV
jgi:hypothetical protein